LEYYSLLSAFFTALYIDYLKFNLDDPKAIVLMLFFYFSHIIFLFSFIYIFSKIFFLKNKKKVKKLLPKIRSLLSVVPKSDFFKKIKSLLRNIKSIIAKNYDEPRKEHLDDYDDVKNDKTKGIETVHF
jgi:hypothetical protein